MMNVCRYISACLLLLASAFAHAQTVRDVAKLANTPRKYTDLPPDEYELFADQGAQEAFDNTFRKMMPPDVAKQLKEVPGEKDGILTLYCTQCPMPYAQLDTNTQIKFKRNLLGYWRAVNMRKVLYSDSASYPGGEFYRDASVLNEEAEDDMILSIDEKAFRGYYKEQGTDKYRIIIDSKYELQGKRYLLLYKNLKRAAEVSLVGIDKEGRLIINSYTAIQKRIPNKYIVHQTIVEQLVLEKLNIEQLRYEKEKKLIQGSRHTAPN